MHAGSYWQSEICFNFQKIFTTDGKVNTFMCLLAFAMEVDAISILLDKIGDPVLVGDLRSPSTF